MIDILMQECHNHYMRTTIDIHDEVLGRAKQLAAETKRKLGEVVSDALLEMFSRRDQRVCKASAFKPVDLPTYGRGGVHPGVDLSNNESVQDILDGLDRHEAADGFPGNLSEMR